MNEVIYKDIPGFPGYRAGSDGTIWSSRWVRWSKGNGARFRPLSSEWRQLKSRPNRSGYLVISMRRDGESHWFSQHSLILTTFKGPKPQGMQCCRHLDGNKLNNAAENLCWGTHQENHDDSGRFGSRAKGERCHTARLTEGDVIAIRFLSARGASRSELARMFNRPYPTIKDVLTRHTWAHL